MNNSEALCFCSSQSQILKVKCSGVPSSLAPSAASGERGARAARMVALQLAPPSPIAARAERADAPAPAAARAPMMMRGLGPFFSVVQGAVTVTQVFGSHVAISGLAIFRYGLA